MNSLNYLWLILLLFASAFFSASEVALLTSDKIKLKEMASKGISWAENILKLRLERREETLTAILLLNNLVNIAATVVATILADQIGGVAIVWVTPIMTGVIVLVGEMIPKALGSRKPISISRITLYPMQVLFFILTPLTWVLQKITKGFFWLVHLPSDPNQTSIVTEEDLEAMINMSHQEGIIPTEERVMIERVFEFGDTTVYDVMVPRVDVVSASLKSTFVQLVKIIKQFGHSRIPIYNETPDNIVGILHVKDLIPYLTSKKDLDLEGILREPYFVPESKHISEVFKDMRLKRIHLALVVDEYGGVSGLITLEDLLEELVGEIQDEYDTEEDEIKKLNSNTYLLAGNMGIDQVNELLGTVISDEDYDTLAGFMIGKLGHLGKTGEKVVLDNITFIVEQIKKWRILKVRVISHQKDKKEGNK